ncbi:MAG: hypothetical protein KKD44_09420 [Proteobacteria bacterium]|nr:hypothetical protein [Pseudomonadota bacterium]
MNTDHNHDMCKAYFAKLSEFIDQELGDDVCRDIQKHLESCGCCNACLETLKKTIQLCANIKDKPVPSELSRKLKHMIRHRI